jgi:hypothetical protein
MSLDLSDSKLINQHKKELQKIDSYYSQLIEQLELKYSGLLEVEKGKLNLLVEEMRNLTAQTASAKSATELETHERIADLQKAQFKAMQVCKKEYDTVCDVLEQKQKDYEMLLEEQNRAHLQEITDLQNNQEKLEQNFSEKVTELHKEISSNKHQIITLTNQLKTADAANLNGGNTKQHGQHSNQQSPRAEAARISSPTATAAHLTNQEALEEIENLKKYRYVLFEKLQMADKKILTLQEDLKMMRAMNLEMDKELRQQNSSVSVFKKELSEKTASISYYKKIAETFRLKNRRIRKLLESYSKHISEVVLNNPGNPLNGKLEKIMKKFESSDDMLEKDPPQVTNELAKQRDFLAGRIEKALNMKNQTEKTAEMHKQHFIKDNNALIQECLASKKDLEIVKQEYSRLLALLTEHGILDPMNKKVNKSINPRENKFERDFENGTEENEEEFIEEMDFVDRSRSNRKEHQMQSASTFLETSTENHFDDDEDEEINDELYTGGIINPTNMFPKLRPQNKHR